MLREGLHEAFAEIFNIIKKQHQVKKREIIRNLRDLQFPCLFTNNR